MKPPPPMDPALRVGLLGLTVVIGVAAAVVGNPWTLTAMVILALSHVWGLVHDRRRQRTED